MQAITKLMDGKANLIISALVVSVGLYGLYSFSHDEHSAVYEERKNPIKEYDEFLFPQYIRNPKGLLLYIRRWLVTKPKGCIFLLHGFQEHTSRFELTCNFLNSHGYSVVGIDHQGHGQSEGDPQHTQNFKELLDDYLMFMDRESKWMREGKGPYQGRMTINIDSNTPDSVPVFVFGHSMGGLLSFLVRNTLLQQHNYNNIPQIAGLLASSPCLHIDEALATPFLLSMAGILSTFFPKLPVTSISPESLSSIKAVAQIINRDPLVRYDYARARMSLGLLNYTNGSHDIASQIPGPAFITHSINDKVTSIKGTRRFVKAIKEGIQNRGDTGLAAQVDFVELENTEHEPLNDVGREKLLEQYLAFLDDVVSQKSK